MNQSFATADCRSFYQSMSGSIAKRMKVVPNDNNEYEIKQGKRLPQNEDLIPHGIGIVAAVSFSNSVGPAIGSDFLAGTAALGVYFVVALGSALTIFLVSRMIKKGSMKKMISLIDQSEYLLANPQSTPGKYLDKLHAKLVRNGAHELKVLDLAYTISDGNKTGDLCRGTHSLNKYKRRIINGEVDLINIQIDEDEN